MVHMIVKTMKQCLFHLNAAMHNTLNVSVNIERKTIAFDTFLKLLYLYMFHLCFSE